MIDDERTLSTPQTASSKATPEPVPIFGLYYLEEHDFDLNEVIGCFGTSSVNTPGDGGYTYTCPTDDVDVSGV